MLKLWHIHVEKTFLRTVWPIAHKWVNGPTKQANMRSSPNDPNSWQTRLNNVLKSIQERVYLRLFITGYCDVAAKSNNYETPHGRKT
jgi:hypothetical protein